MLTIEELYFEISKALAAALPSARALWVRGEIQSISDRTGHCYMDLVDSDGPQRGPAPVLKVKCWRNGWQRIKAALAHEGIALQPGMVVEIRGSIDFYAPRAEVGFILAQIDIAALLGRLAVARAELIRKLASEGLLDRNRSLQLPQVPLRVGLVASPGTEGMKDFLGQLESSGFAFQVSHVAASVQGHEAPMSIARALRTLDPLRCDLVVMVRGGGSRGDLAAFDSEEVSRAVAGMSVPVWTGIGHTGDQSVADLVAHRSFVTPTECGRELAARIGEWWDSLAGTGLSIGERAQDHVDRAATETHRRTRRLAAATRHQTSRHAESLERRARRIGFLPGWHLGIELQSLLRSSIRAGSLARAQVNSASERAASWRKLISAYDVTRQLERGYTLTLDAGGRILRSSAEVRSGGVLVTRFADGDVRSLVDQVRRAASGGESGTRSGASATGVDAGDAPVVQGEQGAQARRPG